MQPWRKVGGRKRWDRASKKAKSAHMSMMAHARWKKERKRQQAAHRKRRIQAARDQVNTNAPAS
jgi:hypothetical protein